ncbi:MAG: ABC transporter substrate-binding protein, partial [Candidatus Hodarchaeales archaeon]
MTHIKRNLNSFHFTFLTFLFVLIFLSNNASISTVSCQMSPQSINWINNRGFVSQIYFKIITSDELMVQSLRGNEIDIVGQFVDVSLITQSDLVNPDFGFSETRRLGFGHITLNTNKFPTNIRALRQGMAYALDKVELQQRALGGESFPTDSPIVPSQGIWSCEYEFADCEFPGGDTYYFPLPAKANETVLAQGWYDYDGDGWREFFNGTVLEEGETIWDSTVVYFQHGTETYNADYNGYTYKGKTFAEVAGVNRTLTGSDSGQNLLKADFQTGSWIEEGSYQFDIMGSAGGVSISTVVTMTVEAFHSIGIKSNPSFVTFSTLLMDMRAGDYHGVFFAHTDLGPNPLFLQSFTSNFEANLEQARWVNSTYDELWDIISSSTDFNEVLDATYKAQQIWWQEQPKVVMYNNKLTSMYRTNRFIDQVLVPGEGSFGYWSMAKVRLPLDFYQDENYPNWPFGGLLRYGLPQPMSSQNSLNDSANYYTQTVLGMIEEKLIYRHPKNRTWVQGSGVAESYDIIAPCSTFDCIDAGAEGGFKVVWHIRDDVKWHNGDLLLAEDVAFSFQMLYNYSFIDPATSWHIDFNKIAKTVTVISNN